MVTPAEAYSTRVREFLLWGLLGLAASPVLVDTARYLLTTPWGAYSLVFWALFVREVLRNPAAPDPRGAGWLLVAVGIGIELVMVQAGWPRWGRPGVALAMLGMALGLGHPRLAMALLALWTVPLPSFIAQLASPGLEGLLLKLAGFALSPLGIPLEVVSRTPRETLVTAGSREMPVFASDGGLYLVALLAGLAFYTAVRARLGPARVLRRMITWAALALPTQLAAVIAAGAALAAGLPEIARLGLTHAPWMLTALAVLALQTRGGGSR